MSYVVLVDANRNSLEVAVELNFIGFVCDNHGLVWLVGWLSL
jgi:hypothetical protein